VLFIYIKHGNKSNLVVIYGTLFNRQDYFCFNVEGCLLKLIQTSRLFLVHIAE